MNKYAFRDYNPKYPQLFEDEKERLISFLEPEVTIEHFGSTAIPGLSGKGIIDIYVTVTKDKIQMISKLIQTAGYEYRPNAGTSERFFSKE